MPLCYGREIKLGYGYDEDHDYIYPFECNPQRITKDEEIYFYPDVPGVDFVINDLKKKLGLFLYDGSLNYFNFLNKYDNNEYYLINLELETKFEECDGCDKYPKNIPKYIWRIDYGIQIQFCIEKHQFFNKDDDEIEKLLGSVYEKNFSKLTSVQLETKCEVLINFKERRQMTLKEIFEFLWDKQNIQKYQSAIRFWYNHCSNSNTKTLLIKNDEVLESLMYNLYTFYQKFEKNFTKNSDIYDIQLENLKIDKIKIELENSKNEFKNVGENDFIGMYKTTKKLFKCYQAYLDYMFKNRLNVDDEDKATYKKWMRKLQILSKNIDVVLNSLLGLYEFCQKTERIYKNIDYPFIPECKFEDMYSDSIQNIFQKIQEKFELIRTDEYIEAYKLIQEIYHLFSNFSYFMLIEEIDKKREFWKEKIKNLMNNIDQEFNFIEGPLKSFELNSENSSYLIRKCPSTICNDNDEFRRWKCSKCDGFMKVETVECDCGYKKFEDLNFYCEYCSRQQIAEKLNQFNDENQNRNKQAQCFSSLLMSGSEQIFTDILQIIVKSDFTDEINEIIKKCFDNSRIEKIISVKGLESSNIISKIGYIKSLPVPKKMLNDNIKDVNYLMTKCPLSDKCKDNRFKLHLCFECKKLTKIKTLKCNCNEEKSINNSHFICDNEHHRSQFDKNVKQIITQQLKKQEDKHEVELFLPVMDSKIISFIEILEIINRIELDGDTRKLVEDCISNFRS